MIRIFYFVNQLIVKSRAGPMHLGLTSFFGEKENQQLSCKY
uniref:Uncharacterized protein n=1 Tax=Rhizophora mucronata TaxID=61149 RepID=A0A2P2QQZ0_RHIMU